MAHFYLDENIPRVTQRVLAQNAHDVIHAFDLGNRSVSDPEHLLVAARDARILVTYNRRDFRELHRYWTALNAWGNLAQRYVGILTSWGDVPKEQWADLVDSFVRLGQTWTTNVGMAAPAAPMETLRLVGQDSLRNGLQLL